MFIESENTQDLKAPEERNVLVIWGRLRSSGAESTFFGFSLYKHFVPPGLKSTQPNQSVHYCANFRHSTLDSRLKAAFAHHSSLITHH